MSFLFSDWRKIIELKRYFMTINTPFFCFNSLFLKDSYCSASLSRTLQIIARTNAGVLVVKTGPKCGQDR